MKISHFVSLSVAGGIEFICTTLMRELERLGHDNLVINKGNRIDSMLTPQLAAQMPVIAFKKPLGFKLPDQPALLRRLAYHHLLKRPRKPDVMLSWSQINASTLIDVHRRLGARTLHYEHGSAWLSRPTRQRRRHLEKVDGVICVSYAARRMLEERWQLTGKPIVVQHNPLVLPVAHQTVEAPQQRSRRWRLGIAGRLVPVKGFPIAILALAELVKQGLDAELHVVGHGMMEASLRELTARLQLEDRVMFHGFCTDMPAYLRSLDLMLCPSFRETFGMVSIEAAAHGCPVIASRVDGLPETLEEGVSGITLPCTEPVDALSAHATHSSIPAQVYDPEHDALRTPLGIAPCTLATTIADVLTTPGRLEAMRSAGRHHVAQHFALDDYVQAMHHHLETMGAD